MADAEGARERPGMAGAAPQRARTAGLKREEQPGKRERTRLPWVQNLSPLHAIDLPGPCLPQASHARHKSAANISQRSRA